MPQLKPGLRLKSAVCDTSVVVIATPSPDLEVTCGGAPLIAVDDDAPAGASLDPDAAEGSQRGKRYVNEAGDLELLCANPGKGSLACDGTPLALKSAKPLPASD
jgi:hypothetical protein